MKASKNIAVQVRREILAREVSAVLSTPPVPDPTGSSTSDRMAAFGFMRAARLQAVSNWMANKLQDSAGKLERDVLKALSAHKDLSDASLNELFMEWDRLAREAFDRMAREAEDDAVEAHDAAVSQTVAAATEVLGSAHGKPSAGDVDTTVMGASISDHFDKMRSDLIFRLKAAARTAAQAGDSPTDLARRIRGDQTALVKGKFFTREELMAMADKPRDLAVSVKAVIVDDEGRVLILKDAHSDWNDLPGGHIRDGETPSDALFREVHEETGLTVTKSDAIGTTELTLGGRATTVIFYRAKATGEPETSSEHDSFEWVRPDALATLNLGVLLAPTKAALEGSKVSASKSCCGDHVRAEAPPATVLVRLFDATDSSIAKVAQAIVTSFANAADESVVDSSGDEVRMGYVWVSAQDGRVCPLCEFYDGNKYDENKDPVGDAPELENEPPAHFGCRCALVPCDLDAEVPQGKFDDYLTAFSDQEQREAFGDQAVEAYRRGEIGPAALMGQRDHAMDLEQFRAGAPRLHLDPGKFRSMGEASAQEANVRTLDRRSA